MMAKNENKISFTSVFPKGIRYVKFDAKVSKLLKIDHFHGEDKKVFLELLN